MPREQTYYFSIIIFLYSTMGFEQWRDKNIKLVEVIFVSVIHIINGSVLFNNQKCQYKIFHILVWYACLDEVSLIAVIGDDLHYFTQTHWTTWHLENGSYIWWGSIMWWSVRSMNWLSCSLHLQMCATSHP